MDPDSDPDPAIFVKDLQEANKKTYFFSYLRTFIRIHWYTVPPTFQFTVWEDGFDYIVFFQMGIKKKKNLFLKTSFSAYYFLKVHLHHFSKIKIQT
jgi:hypothetical protein